MAFNGWGDALHLFSRFWWYDNVGHINLPCFLSVLLSIALSRLDVVPDPAMEAKARHTWLVGMGLITLRIGVTMASFSEIHESVVDNWFGQHLHIGETNTNTDLADGFIGAATGGLLLAAWAAGRVAAQRAPPPGARRPRIAGLSCRRLGRWPRPRRGARRRAPAAAARQRCR